ncbi:MAG: COG3650 family protein [Vitreimonas sp.]
MRALMLAAALAACAEQPSSATPPPDAPAAEATLTPEQALARMPAWDQARAAGVDFRAVGQEPGWMLDIYTETRMRLVWDYGENTADFPLTAPATTQEGATHYETMLNGRTLSVTIRRTPCQDAMSGEAYPAAVEIAIDGRTLRGCGKSV